MIQGMVGRKRGMTQIFDEAGLVHPVTVIECGPNVVTQIRTVEKDGYEAVQLGFGIDETSEQAGARTSSSQVATMSRKICGKSRLTTSRSSKSDR